VKYKGYTAVLKADEEQGILFGRVLGLRDVITFQAETVSQAIKEFHISVDTYLELCRSRQQSPEKPYSGNFMVRVNPELHRQIAILAQTKSVSINSLVASLIRDAAKRRGGSGNVVRSVTSEKVMDASKTGKKKSKREAEVVQNKRKASTR
jgi:predicted HicB family RNase H-like nuclease